MAVAGGLSVRVYSRLQSKLSPKPRIFVVMVLPDFSFHSHTFDEIGTAQVVAAHALLLQLALDDNLRGNARVVGARNPDGVVPQHAVVAREAIHDGLVERVPHVPRALDVRRRQLDAGGGLACSGCARATDTHSPVAAPLPFGGPASFQRSGFERLEEGMQAGLFGRGGALEVMGRLVPSERGLLPAHWRGPWAAR